MTATENALRHQTQFTRLKNMQLSAPYPKNLKACSWRTLSQVHSHAKVSPQRSRSSSRTKACFAGSFVTHTATTALGASTWRVRSALPAVLNTAKRCGVGSQRIAPFHVCQAPSYSSRTHPPRRIHPLPEARSARKTRPGTTICASCVQRRRGGRPGRAARRALRALRDSGTYSAPVAVLLSRTGHAKKACSD